MAPGFRHGSGRGAPRGIGARCDDDGAGRWLRQSSGGTLNILMPAGDPDHLDPALWYTLVSWNIGFTICDTLVTYPDAGGEAGKEIVGGLAQLPKVSNGGKAYTFTLSPGSSSRTASRSRRPMSSGRSSAC